MINDNLIILNILETMDNSTDNKKKEYSYTYWVNKDPNQIKMDCQPKKVDDPASIPQQPQSIHSQWNTSGTWEERKVTMDQLKKTLQQLIGVLYIYMPSDFDWIN